MYWIWECLFRSSTARSDEVACFQFRHLNARLRVLGLELKVLTYDLGAGVRTWDL